jgi:cell wall-associated NlpC family hydrolase
MPRTFMTNQAKWFPEGSLAELPDIDKHREDFPILGWDLQPGDLVFFNTLNRAFSHVGIYLGNNQFVHAPSKGRAVRVEDMDMAYWKTRFNGARRVLDAEAAPR